MVISSANNHTPVDKYQFEVAGTVIQQVKSQLSGIPTLKF